MAATYSFDEVRIEPFEVTGQDAWQVRSPSLTLALAVGRRTWLGWLLRAVPRRLATSPTWCTVTDPVARVVMRGVRTRGSAGNGRREFYAATDHRAVLSASGTLDGAPCPHAAAVDLRAGAGAGEGSGSGSGGGESVRTEREVGEALERLHLDHERPLHETCATGGARRCPRAARRGRGTTDWTARCCVPQLLWCVCVCERGQWQG
ncbi:MAG: hypothetical protein ACPF9W_11410, partial [Nocardioides sp.]